MALSKEIILDNGITVTYHRVVSLNKVTNISNVIEIASYTSKEKREEEKEKIEKGESMNIYIETEYISTDYDESINIENVYDYLKTLDKFKDAEDV